VRCDVIVWCSLPLTVQVVANSSVPVPATSTIRKSLDLNFEEECDGCLLFC
jgi:hypothetical protein